MLVLSRKTRQQIQIGDNVVVTILLVKGNTVRVGIEAPRNVRVVRSELPLHEETEGATQQLQIAVETEESPVAETRESRSPNQSSASLKPMRTSVERADRAQRTGPVLESLRRRGGLGALSRPQSSADSNDLGPIFDHH